MGRPRTFDYDEARRLHATGELTRRELAERFNVSLYAIAYATKPQLREYARNKQLDYRVPCEDCGAPMHGRYVNSRFCKPCSYLRVSTNVRPDALRCTSCREWKPDDAFPRNRRGSLTHRGRHGSCRACCTEAKRDYRRRNPTHARDYSRKRRLQKVSQ